MGGNEQSSLVLSVIVMSTQIVWGTSYFDPALITMILGRICLAVPCNAQMFQTDPKRVHVIMVNSTLEKSSTLYCTLYKVYTIKTKNYKMKIQAT